MVNNRDLLVNEICGEKHGSGNCCCYFNTATKSCSLLEDLSLPSFGKLYAARCGIPARIRKHSRKIANRRSNYLGDSETVTEDLEQDAYEALVKKFSAGDFPFKYPSRIFADIVSYACSVIDHSKSGKLPTIKKYIGKYCISFNSGFGCANQDVHTRYGSKDCGNINPSSLNPSCNSFKSPSIEAFEMENGEERQISSNEKSEEGILEKLETHSLIEIMWLQAQSVPEMRKVIRINKYLAIIGSFGNEQFKISILEEKTEIDHKTIKSDLQGWLEFKGEIQNCH